MGPVFLLSPARCGGQRGSYLLRDGACFELALRLRAGEANLSEVFTFMSGLYFRGKVAYANAFGRRSDAGPHALVIVPGRGLLPLDTAVTLRKLRAIAQVPVDVRDDRYCRPLLRDTRRLHRALPPEVPVVLLGSIATRKYTQLLGEALGERLHFPAEFRGIGDMSRGALMLRRAASGQELVYERVSAIPARSRHPRADEPSPAAPPERRS